MVLLDMHDIVYGNLHASGHDANENLTSECCNVVMVTLKNLRNLKLTDDVIALQ